MDRSADTRTDELHRSPTVWLPSDASDSVAERGGGQEVSKIIYVNGCWDAEGCVLEQGSNDALANRSTIPSKSPARLSTFAHSVEVWDATIECLREVYLPYDITIVDSRVEADPADSSTAHHEAILAGAPGEILDRQDVFGIAPYSCSPANNVISFSFANVIGDSAIDLCWTVAQESAHSFGLDHAYECLDPMTYLPGCGQKFFRNQLFDCGEGGPRPCQCGGRKQNSHNILLAALGPGSVPPPPTVGILQPDDGATLSGDFTISLEATDPRLVDKLELVVNGWVYEELEGHGYAERADPYEFTLPSGLPDSVLDIEVRAYNDLESMASAKITVTKGAPCASATACLAGQLCENGRCLYPAPTVELGEVCERDMDCVSLSCPSVDGDSRCSQTCIAGVEGQCPDDFECMSSGGSSICWPVTTAGCCSAGAGQGPTVGQIALFLLCAMLLGWRGRRRDAPEGRSPRRGGRRSGASIRPSSDGRSDVP